MSHDSRDRDPLQHSARFGIALLAVTAACWIEAVVFSAAPLLSLTPLSLAVAISAVFGGFRGGAIAVLLAAFAIDFFLVQPESLLTLGDRRTAFTFMVYVLFWLGFCLATERRYRRARNDRSSRLHAERAARQAERLSQLTAALGQARTPAAVIEASIQEPLHALRADSGMLLIISGDGNRAELARAVASTPAESDAWRDVPLSTRSPVADAVGRGAPVIIESHARATAEYASLPDDLYSRDSSSFVVVPLVIGSRVVAVVRLDFKKQRTFSADDREYLFALGPRAAQALDRTWQYESAQRERAEAESLRERADQELSERQKVELALRASEGRYRALAARTSRLHGLTAALSEAVTVRAVAQAVIQQGQIVVGATAGEVTLLVGKDQFETLVTEPYGRPDAEPRRFAADAGLCETEAVDIARPVFVGSFTEWQERYWRSASRAADGGFVSCAALPLMVEGSAIGVLTFYFTLPVNFDDSYRALLVSVAAHCAQALDRARLYEAAQRARSEAETANRLKDEFVSIVSHELRTPLNAILGWTSMLQRGALDPLVSARALQSIHANATRQTRLIDELLDFSRIIAGGTRLDLELIDLRDLVRGVVETMIPTAAANGQDLRLSPVPPVMVQADMRRLEQVFFNLLTNALKFTPSGGRISLETTLDGETVEVRVIDNGVGIEPEFLPYAFDRFRQADSTTTRNHAGLGLGLSIARQLVEAHKGTIEVRSEGKGHGSTFIVRLPVAGLRPERTAEPGTEIPGRAVTASGAPRLDGIRVLIVDDEPDAREIMAHELSGCGAVVSQAGSVSDALEILEGEIVDVLLADIAMPDEDGYALIRKIRASPGRMAAIPAAAVTAHARDDERQQALAAGFHLHVAKPVEPAQLARTVESLARGTSIVH